MQRAAPQSRDVDGDGTPSLYRYTFTDGAYTEQELIAGIENMQLLYGDGANFREADDASLTWNDVTSVKISLLLRSEQEVGTDWDRNTAGDGKYIMLGNDVTPTDLRVRRRVFNATAEIRNRTT